MRVHWRLFPILVLALGLRVVHLDYGLPRLPHPDEMRIVVPAFRIANSDPLDLHPSHFHYPALQVYLLSAWFHVGKLVHPPPAARRPLDVGAKATLRARWLTMWFGVATVAAAYALGFLACGSKTALLTGLLLAVAPFHTLDSHYANVDVPMTFWLVMAVCFALAYLRSPRIRWYLLAAACLGAAAATKYSAVAAAPLLPAVCWLARRGHESLWRTVQLVVLGAAVCLGVFLLCAPYTLIEFDSFVKALKWERSYTQKGHWGFDVNPGGWINQRGVYQLVAGLPFALGLPLYVLSLGGVIRLLLRPRKAGLAVAAAVVPVFLVLSEARVVFLRYLLPLLPFFVLAAAHLLTGLLKHEDRRARAAGWLLLFGALGYTATLTASQLAGLEPQNATLASAWIRKNVAPGSEIALAGAPWVLDLPKHRYDVRSFNLRDALTGTHRPKWLVVSGWYERALARGKLRGRAKNRFLEALGTKYSPYERVIAFETRFFTESLYGALDPYFENQFQSPDFVVYRRRGNRAEEVRKPEERAAQPAPTAPWSVLVLSLDTLRPDYMSLNGYDRPTTPYLDGLLARSYYFERAVAPVPRTTPALASLLTGSYPHTHRVRRLAWNLPEGITSIAEVFSAAGYQTVAVPTNDLLGPKRNLDRGFDVYLHAGDKRTAPHTTREAVEVLAGLDAERPFFAWVHYIDPHLPYHSDPAIARSFDAGYEGRYAERFGLQTPYDSPSSWMQPFPKDLPKRQAVHENRLPESVNAHIRRLYAADIRATDDALAPLVETALRVAGGRLILVFTADHGESLGEHDFYFDHGDYVYNASAQVPLAFLLPSEHPLHGQARIRAWVSLVDVVPTLFDLMGWRVPASMAAQIEGRSLVPYFEGRRVEPVPVYSESGHSHMLDANRRRVRPGVEGRLRAVWLEGWKLVWNPFQTPELEWELYDLERDPNETHDLYRPDHPRVAELRAHLSAWLRSGGAAVPALTPEDREQLRALGYVGDDGS